MKNISPSKVFAWLDQDVPLTIIIIIIIIITIIIKGINSLIVKSGIKHSTGKQIMTFNSLSPTANCKVKTHLLMNCRSLMLRAFMAGAILNSASTLVA